MSAQEHVRTSLEEVEKRHERALKSLREAYDTHIRIKKVHDDVIEQEEKSKEGTVDHKRKLKLTSEKAKELLHESETQLREIMKLLEEIGEVKLIVEQIGMNAFSG